MPKNRIWLLALLLVLVLPSLTLGGVDDERTWVRLRYDVKASKGVPAASYTIIETLSDNGSQRARILFSDRAEHNLRVDLRVKESRREGYPDSRWAQFHTVPGGESFAISLVAGQVELHRGGRLLLGFDNSEGLAEENLLAAMELRTSLPDELLAALKSFARIGLAREATFTQEALVLSDVLFPELAGLSLNESLKTEVVAVVGFEPDEHAPLPGELIFGSDYDIPGRIRPEEPKPASLDLPLEELLEMNPEGS